jgi:hypothetical protein
MNLRSWVQQVFDAQQPDSLGQRVQGLVFELALLRGVFDDLWVWTQILPGLPKLAAPVGVAQFTDISFMLTAPWARTNAILIALLCLLGFLRVFRWGYLLAVAPYHLHYAARYCMGKTGHASNVLAFALLALGVAHLAYRDPALRRRAAFGLTMVLLSIGYTWAAVLKLSAAGIAWADGHHLWLWLQEKWVDRASELGFKRANLLQRWTRQSWTFATMQLSFGLLAESLSSLMLVRRCRRVVLLALAAMHLGILWSMQIAFLNNVYLLLAMGLPIAELVDRYLAPRLGVTQNGQAKQPWANAGRPSL